MLKIEPLSKKTLESAIHLIVNIFGCKKEDFDHPRKWMTASLDPDRRENKEIYKSYDTTYLKYYIAMKNKHVVGTTGIYTRKEDEKDSAWIAWYCVDPKYRGKGYGSNLLEFTIDLARKMDKKYIKLYTSYNNDIKEAMKIYEKKGFKITKIENHPNTNQEMIFMEAKL